MKPTVCKYCSAINKHYSFKCPSKPPKKVGDIEEMSYEEYKAKRSSVRNVPIKKACKPTGELKLFLKLYYERNGLCQITGERLQFDVSCFAHVLSKGAYPSLRLCEENIVMCKKEIHDLYDNGSKKDLLEKYPKAILFYELKDKLRYDYYNK